MSTPVKVYSTFRIRCISGELAGMWLWQFDVMKGGLPVSVKNWGGIERSKRSYSFHPKFLEADTAAHRILDLEVAQVMQRLIKDVGIETEIVQS